MVQTVRDDIATNWPGANWLGAGYWPLEPGRTGGELGYRKRHFGLPGTVAGLLGKRSVLAVLIAGAAMGVIMACFAEVASRFSEAGGPYLYARVAFGRLMGILVGWMLYLAQAAAPAANANLFVIYLAEFWPGAKGTWPRFAILTLLVGVLALINARGARQGTVVSNVFTVAKILPLLMVVAAGAAVTIMHPAPWGPAGPMPASAWMKAMVLLIFAYGGFESAMAPMGEAKNPGRDAGVALLAALIACTVIYVLVQWVVVGVLGPGATTDRPLAEVARITMGSRGAALVALGALVSVYGYLSAKLLGMPRVTFALAKGGDLPQLFAAVGPRFHTPWFSILFYAAAVWGLAMVGNFVWNVTLSVVARLFYYAVVCAALIALRRKQPHAAGLRLPGGPVLAVLGIGITVVLATQVDLSKSLILAATVGAAVLNWAWARRADRAKV
ncbi:MAG TPA: APC family permease [Terriglobales bacterium]|nr:APC family permease [Terriglobales bacterium]